ncbi:MAG: hypothetical protein ACR2MM_09180 [Flavobacteriaceae bacterium]
MILGYKPVAPKRVVLVLPMIGMALFVILYIVAAIKYPGGSWKFPDAKDFSFWNNYLCDLLDHNAVNGQLNDARYIARTALAFLCGGLLLLWWYLPSLFPEDRITRTIMWISGILALVTTFFLSSGTHDTTVRIAGFFGAIAFINLFIELYRIGLYRLFILGLFCLIIFLINYYIYETGSFIKGLPIIQKITFLSFLCWFTFLNLSMIKKRNDSRKNSNQSLFK